MHLLHKTASQLLLNEVILFYETHSPNQPLLEKTGKKKNTISAFPAFQILFLHQFFVLLQHFAPFNLPLCSLVDVFHIPPK